MKRFACPILLFSLLALPATAQDTPDLPQAPIDDKWVNPWPDAWENGFQERAAIAIKHNTGKGKYGNTYFENEKGSYPPAMFDVLFGNREQGKTYLQE